MRIFRNTLQALLAVVAVAALLAGLWFGRWALTKANLEQQREANRTSQQFQDGLVAKSRSYVQGYDTATSEAQRKQIALTFCAEYRNLQNPPSDLSAAQARICK